MAGPLTAMDSENEKSTNKVEADIADKWIIIGLCIQPLIFYIYWSPLLDFIKSSLLINKGTLIIIPVCKVAFFVAP